MNADLDGVRVLIVEDEFLLAEELRTVLSRRGCVVLGPVAKLAHGLSLAREAAIDVAVLDVRLGNDDSRPIADALWARGCPFVFATGYAARDIPQGDWNAPILTKPIMHQELFRQLTWLLRRPRITP